MFNNINQILILKEWYGDSDIDIIQGINRYPSNIIEIYIQLKRKIMSN